jgi:FAD binding domain
VWKLRQFSMEIDIVCDVRLSSNCTGPWDQAMSCWLATLLTYIVLPEVKVRKFCLALVITRLGLMLLCSGLNLGMCDAIALAKTISAHLESQCNQLLLDYSTARRARAVQVVELASNSWSILRRLTNSTFILRWIVGLILSRVGFLKSRIVWRLSGLGTKAAVK